MCPNTYSLLNFPCCNIQICRTHSKNLLTQIVPASSCTFCLLVTLIRLFLCYSIECWRFDIFKIQTSQGGIVEYFRVRRCEVGRNRVTLDNENFFTDVRNYWILQYNQMYIIHVLYYSCNDTFSGGDPDRAIQEGAGKPSLQTCHRLCQTSFGSRGEHVLKVFKKRERIQKTWQQELLEKYNSENHHCLSYKHVFID